MSPRGSRRQGSVTVAESLARASFGRNSDVWRSVSAARHAELRPQPHSPLLRVLPTKAGVTRPSPRRPERAFHATRLRSDAWAALGTPQLRIRDPDQRSRSETTSPVLQHGAWVSSISLLGVRRDTSSKGPRRCRAERRASLRHAAQMRRTLAVQSTCQRPAPVPPATIERPR